MTGLVQTSSEAMGVGGGGGLIPVPSDCSSGLQQPFDLSSCTDCA